MKQSSIYKFSFILFFLLQRRINNLQMILQESFIFFTLKRKENKWSTEIYMVKVPEVQAG